jgi:hypothetical protein
MEVIKMNTAVAKVLNNPNIHVGTYKDDVYLQIVPQDREVTTRYANAWLKKVIANKDEILEQLENQLDRRLDVFVFSIAGHNVDGLYETNSLLLFPDSKAYSNYS